MIFHRRLLAGGAMLSLAVTGVAACGSSSSSSTTTTVASASPAAGGTTITIKNFAFSPATLTVAAGTKITVVNADTATHTVTASGTAKGSFDTGDVGVGKSTTFTAPSKPGSYPYICTIHQFMQGTLVVK